MYIVKDLLGEVVGIGDTIAYATSRNRRGAQNVGVVTDIKMHRGYLQVVVECHIVSNGEASEAPVLLKNFDRLVKL